MGFEESLKEKYPVLNDSIIKEAPEEGYITYDPKELIYSLLKYFLENGISFSDKESEEYSDLLNTFKLAYLDGSLNEFFEEELVITESSVFYYSNGKRVLTVHLNKL